MMDGMDLENSADATIVRNLDLLRAIHDHIEKNIEPMLGKAVIQVVSGWAEQKDWLYREGEIGDGSPIGKKYWEIRAESPDETSDGYILRITLEAISENRNYWIEHFLERDGARIALWLWSDIGSEAAIRRAFASVLTNDPDLRQELLSAGFLHDPKYGVYMPLSFSTEEMATAFEEAEFDVALSPLRDALNRIDNISPALDRLCGSLRTLFT